MAASAAVVSAEGEQVRKEAAAASSVGGNKPRGAGGDVGEETRSVRNA